MKSLTQSSLLVALALLAIAVPSHGQVAVRGDTVYTMEGAPLSPGVVLIRDGKIESVGAPSAVQVPEGFELLEAKVVTPGLVDVHSTVGLSGIYNSSTGQVRDQDQLDKTNAIQPELRALDAFDPQEPLVEYVRQFGVTTVHTGHGPGALVSGQTLIAKTRGRTVDEAVIVPGKMIAMTLGPSVAQNFKSPGTSSKGAALIRQAFLGAKEYADKLAEASSEDEDGDEPDDEDAKKAKAPDRDLGKDVLAAVLRGETKALITAQTAAEIATALRLKRELGFDLVLDGAAEAYLLLDEIREAGVPVLLHPLMARIPNQSFETAAKLRDAGIPFAIQTGFESYVPKSRVLLFEAAIAAANGLTPEQALAAITLDPARILDIDDRVGSLAPGKDGDVVLFAGDPFEYTTQVCGVIIEGEVLSRDCY